MWLFLIDPPDQSITFMIMVKDSKGGDSQSRIFVPFLEERDGLGRLKPVREKLIRKKSKKEFGTKSEKNLFFSEKKSEATNQEGDRWKVVDKLERNLNIAACRKALS